jgi:hypothetical protein
MPRPIQEAGEVLQVIARAEASNRAIHMSREGRISIASTWRNYFVQIKSIFIGTDFRQASHVAAKELFLALLQKETEEASSNGAERWKTLRERVPALRSRANSENVFNTLEIMVQLQDTFTKINAEQATKDSAKKLQGLSKEGLRQGEVMQSVSASQGTNTTRFETTAALELYASHCSYSGNRTLFHYFDAIQAYPKLRKKIETEYDKLLAQNLQELEKAYLDAPEQVSGLEPPPDLIGALLVTATRTARAGGPISRPL